MKLQVETTFQLVINFFTSYIYSHDKSWRFSDINIFHNIVIGLDIGAREPISSKISVQNHDRSSHRGDRAFQRKIWVHENLPLQANVDGSYTGWNVSDMATEWQIFSALLSVQIFLRDVIQHLLLIPEF